MEFLFRSDLNPTGGSSLILKNYWTEEKALAANSIKAFSNHPWLFLILEKKKSLKIISNRKIKL